jgi:hypothetical protein
MKFRGAHGTVSSATTGSSGFGPTFHFLSAVSENIRRSKIARGCRRERIVILSLWPQPTTSAFQLDHAMPTRRRPKASGEKVNGPRQMIDELEVSLPPFIASVQMRELFASATDPRHHPRARSHSPRPPRAFYPDCARPSAQLWSMINAGRACGWTTDGKAFTVNDLEVFESRILPGAF